MSQGTPSTGEEPWLEVLASRYLTSWLAEQNIGLAVSTYQSGKLFLLGRQPSGQLSVFERTFPQSMGLCASADGQTVWLATQYQLWRLENALAEGQTHQEHDRLYVPRVGHTTGDLDIHDVAVEDDGRVVFVATGFGCVATLSERLSFRPLWRPPFLSAIVAEDRCHLNGLALRDGKARYVTCVSQSDVADGWRDARREGGCVLDIATNDVLATGLSMPHSPRWHRGQLWLLNAGTGELGTIDLQRGQFEPVAFCPGFLRGLAFVGDYAVVTLSKPRHDVTFSGLPLEQTLTSRRAAPQCGLQVIDLRTGQIAHWIRFEGLVTELYDTVALPGVVRPMALGFKTDEINRLVTIESGPTAAP
ncbi:MAG: TIGR03032 family protein [Planctomycetaceae bacterium]